MENQVDVLDQDNAISGQKFACVSFISPEKILKQKQIFFYEEFLKHFDFESSIKRFQAFLHFVSFKYNLNFDKVMEDVQEFVKSEQKSLINFNIHDEYLNFLEKNEERLTKDFSKSNGFRTSVRGLKIRGSFETQEEAEMKCKQLRQLDPNHDIYVGPVGSWMPWEPDAYKTGRVEYLEEELNELMNEKNKNQEQARREFDYRVKESKETAIKENKEIAKKSGNKLTQNIQKDGTLYTMNNTAVPNMGFSANNERINNTGINSNENEVVKGAKIVDELFDKENIK